MLLNIFQGREKFWLYSDPSFDDLVAMDWPLASLLFDIAVGDTMCLHNLVLKFLSTISARDHAYDDDKVDVFEVDDIAILDYLSDWDFDPLEQFVKLSTDGAFECSFIDLIEDLLGETRAKKTYDNSSNF